MTAASMTHIDLFYSGKRIPIETEHWLEALKSLKRCDAAVVIHRPHFPEGTAYEAVRWDDDAMTSYYADSPEEALESARRHVEKIQESRRRRWMRSFDLLRAERHQKRLVETNPVL